MKNLIKFQSIVLMIEESENVNHKSVITYNDEWEMVIETPFWSRTQLYKEIADTINTVIGYVESNNKIRIYEVRTFEEPGE